MHITQSVISALFNLLYRRAKGPNELIAALSAHAEHTKSPRSTKSRQFPIRSITHEPGKTSPRPTLERIILRSPSERKDVAFYESPPSSPSSIPYSLSTTDSEKTEESVVKVTQQKRPFNHQRSHSIPAILVDNFDSAEYITWNSADIEIEARPPVYELDPSTLKGENAASTKHSICDSVRSRPRIFPPKLWGKDRKSKPLKRCRSSPQLYTGPTLPLPLPQADHLTGSESENLSEAKLKLKKTKSWKGLRKARSGTLPESKSNLLFLKLHCLMQGFLEPVSKADRKAEKKKSQTLRTHPYEAPYFAPPPVPAMPVHITFVTEHTSSDHSSHDSSPKSSLDRKPSRRFSLKS